MKEKPASGPVYIRWLDRVKAEDLPHVGGKNASIGDMIQALEAKGVQTPRAVAITSEAYWAFVDANGLRKPIQEKLSLMEKGHQSLSQVGAEIRRMFLEASFPDQLAEELQQAYWELSRQYGRHQVDVAVRSSATAEDLPGASFAGQQDSFLNIRGPEALLDASKRCFASLYNDRAISYRRARGFEHMKVALCLCIQKMVRADQAGSGIIFTVDTDTGFPHLVILTAAWGLGESVVQGCVNPDLYTVFKPFLHREDCVPIIERVLGTKETKCVYDEETSGVRYLRTSGQEQKSFVLEDEEVLRLSRWASLIEEHFGRPMDIEWAKDGEIDDLFVVQARPIPGENGERRRDRLRILRLERDARPVLTGVSIGEGIARGHLQFVRCQEDIRKMTQGPLLVSEMANTSWLPILQEHGVQGLITDFGGPNSHAATLSRELGIPAVLGTQKATRVLSPEGEATLVALRGDFGYVYEGRLDYEEEWIDPGKIPETETRVRIDIDSVRAAYRWWPLPSDGVGLARIELILQRVIKAHPLALLHLDRVEPDVVRRQILKWTASYADAGDYFIDLLSYSLARIAASQHPRPVMARFSALEPQEYAALNGAGPFEFKEGRPARGVSRYLDPFYKEAFELELKAVDAVRRRMGLENLNVVLPFCASIQDADEILEVLGEHGLHSRDSGARAHLSCDLPENMARLEAFARRFDGLSVDMARLPLLASGIDKKAPEGEPIPPDFAREILEHVIARAQAGGCEVTVHMTRQPPAREVIPSLVESGIYCISVPPEDFALVKEWVAQSERSGAL